MKITPINSLLSVTLPMSASNFDDGQESASSGYPINYDETGFSLSLVPHKAQCCHQQLAVWVQYLAC